MGFLGSGKPTEEVIRQRKHRARVGVIQKAVHDAKPPEKGVTKLKPVINERWDKKMRRYRYCKGVKSITGKSLGGRFIVTPDYAPPDRKTKKPRR